MGRDVKKASEYRKRAEECLALAKQVPEGEHRKQLQEMARTWNALAEDRERVTRKHSDSNARDPNAE